MKDYATRMKKFYQGIFSNEWTERLKAYDCIEEDLRLRGCYILNDDKWEDMKLLAGQIISIHCKKYLPLDMDSFVGHLTSLYDKLMRPLAEDKSEGHEVSQRLLIDIYDDDDRSAQRAIRHYFSTNGAFGSPGISEEQSVLENLFRCYETMMQQVEERYAALSV